jgi:hypothetical protein
MLNKEQIEEYQVRNRNFVFTGRLASLTRDQATQMVQERGGQVLPRVNNDVHYLIYGDDVGATKWNAVAKYTRVQKRSEQWFMAAMLATTPGFTPRKSVPAAKPINRAPEVEEAAPRQRRVRVQ